MSDDFDQTDERSTETHDSPSLVCPSDPTLILNLPEPEVNPTATDGGTVTSLPEPVCELCGEVIRKPDQRCPALDDGRCAP